MLWIISSEMCAESTFVFFWCRMRCMLCIAWQIPCILWSLYFGNNLAFGNNMRIQPIMLPSRSFGKVVVYWLDLWLPSDDLHFLGSECSQDYFQKMCVCMCVCVWFVQCIELGRSIFCASLSTGKTILMQQCLLLAPFWTLQACLSETNTE